MSDPDQYAAEQAAMLRDDWQFSRIFAGKAQRGFTALLALRADLQQVIVQVNEPAILAIKFEWWRNEISRGFAGEAQHPLARALAQHLGDAGIASEYCIELVDAAEMENETGSRFSEQDFRLYLYRSGGVLAEQLAQLSGANERRILDAARRLGELKRMNDLVLATGAMINAGVWWFPGDWLDTNINPQKVIASPESDDAKRLLENLLAALDNERIIARTAMEGIKLPPALALQWSLAQRDYVTARRNPQSALGPEPPKGNPLLRLWSAWRGARRTAKSPH